MISLVDCAIAVVVSLSIGVLIGIGGFGRPTSGAKPAAQQNAGLLQPYVPQREFERVPVPPCLRQHAAMYALRFRN